MGCAALTGLMYCAAIESYAGLLYPIIGVLLSCYLYNLVSARSSVRRLQVEVPPLSRATEGTGLTVPWSVRNPSDRPTGVATVETGWGRLGSIPAAAPGESTVMTPQLHFPRRGVLDTSALRLRASTPYGLLSVSRPLHGAGEIVVRPRVYPCDPPPVSGFLPMVGGRLTGMHRSSAGDHFHGVRPLQSGDPLRLVHWPSSAKGRGLMVREFDEELSGRAGLLVDTRGGQTPNGEPVLDWVARAAASLALAALDAGHQVYLADIAGQLLLSIPPFADPDFPRDALARLRETPPGDAEALSLQAVPSGVPRNASLCFVLGNPWPGLGDALEREGYSDRNLAVYLPDFVSDVPNAPWRHLHRFTGEGILPEEGM